MEVYMLTGLMLDRAYGYAPSQESVTRHTVVGLQKAWRSADFLSASCTGWRFCCPFLGSAGLSEAPLTVDCWPGAALPLERRWWSF